jgi:predicted Ser/Thr protein kinase
MGLVEEKQYSQLFERYVNHVSHWVKKERVRNEITGRMEDPDEELMSEVERTLGVGGKKDEFRQDIIARIGAWSIDHPNQKPSYGQVFPKYFTALRESYFDQRKKQLKKTNEDLLLYLAEGQHRLDRESKERVEITLRNMHERYGYCDKCAKDAVGYLLKKRYS